MRNILMKPPDPVIICKWLLSSYLFDIRYMCPHKCEKWYGLPDMEQISIKWFTSQEECIPYAKMKEGEYNTSRHL